MHMQYAYILEKLDSVYTRLWLFEKSKLSFHSQERVVINILAYQHTIPAINCMW